MPREHPNMQKLRELREGVLIELRQRERDVDALRNKLKGIDAAIAAIGGDGQASNARSKTRRNVKRTVLEIITEAGRDGVTSNEVTDRAAVMGRQLDRGSVSSLLSRLKREGTLTFDGERYRLVDPQPPTLDNPAGLKVVQG
jgi:hypothetical protein